MKILLLGDYSSLHKNLKDGLMSLGHEVDIASTGDGWKNIPRDIDLKVEGNYLSKRIKHLINLYQLSNLVKEYDIVQIINPFIFYNSILPNKFFYNKLINNSKKFFMLAAGDDSYFWLKGRKTLLYGPFDDYLKYDRGGENSYYMESHRAFSFNQFVANKCDGIIPIMYEYEISYKGHENLLKTIPIPMNIKKIPYVENNPSNKIVVFHGLNRYGFKGTRHVEEAFKVLGEKYPNELELIIDGHMPLNKYLELMEKTNVIIDQTNSYSLGVNGIYAMAMGKVVLGGAEPESLTSLGVKDSPVINIKPNAKSIINAIEYLLKNKDQIKNIGFASRQFVEKNHNYVDIARKYLEIWKYN